MCRVVGFEVFTLFIYTYFFVKIPFAPEMERRDSTVCEDFYQSYADIILLGFSGYGAYRMRVMSSKIAIFASCGRYIFRNYMYETRIIMSEYAVPQWLFNPHRNK